MSLRELDIVSREFKNPKDVTVIRRDVNLYQNDFKKAVKPFLDEVEKMATKEKKNKVIYFAVIYGVERKVSVI